MKYRKFFIALVLIILLAGFSHLMKLSFDDFVFSDERDVSLIEYDLTNHNFLNETEVFEYYDIIFDELKVNAKEETESIVNQIKLEFELFDSDEKADSFKKTNLIMKFVMKAREIEDFIVSKFSETLFFPNVKISCQFFPSRWISSQGTTLSMAVNVVSPPLRNWCRICCIQVVPALGGVVISTSVGRA